MAELPAHLLLAWSAYLVGTASPGPSNLAIMATAMNAGRGPALYLAAGVVMGSWFWGLAALFGLSALLAAYSQALVALKILGGLYLLWLALKSARSAWSSHAPAPAQAPGSESPGREFLRGAAMHLTNPKAIFVWMSIVSMALPAGARASDAARVVAGCAVLGLCVFMGYALLFSAPPARRVYARLRRWFEGALALIFGYAGLRMLLSRPPGA
ncbi:LysE family translocator [Caenimonas sedimenti]|uniref:LysE family translocator n=1 Tax=Caenimonas sedimenti TaxID=2596921 RepID=UPI002105515F|nr:LysE family transporter [Caenimonas sedimenti]